MAKGEIDLVEEVKWQVGDLTPAQRLQLIALLSEPFYAESGAVLKEEIQANG